MASGKQFNAKHGIDLGEATLLIGGVDPGNSKILGTTTSGGLAYKTLTEGANVKITNTDGDVKIELTSTIGGTTTTAGDTIVGKTGTWSASASTTVTVTSNGHGLSDGMSVPLLFSASTGTNASSSTYVVSGATTNTFTVTNDVPITGTGNVIIGGQSTSLRNLVVGDPFAIETTNSRPSGDFYQTWNNAGVAFNGIRLNITDTASSASSLLADLRVGGASKFSVSKTGAVVTPVGITAGTYNKLTITQPTASATLTIADGKALTVNRSVTLTTDLSGGTRTLTIAGDGTLAIASGKTFTVGNTITINGTDAQTYTMPTASATIPANNQQFFIGTTQIAINQTTGTITGLAGLTSVSNAANGTAISLFTNSTGNITIGSASSTTIIGGNLTVNGTTTTYNSTTVTIDDPVLTLGGDTAPVSDDGFDRGIEFRWHNGSVAKIGFFGYHHDDGRFKFIPDATVTTQEYTGTVGTIEANLVGAVTGTTTNLAGGVGGSIPYQSSANTTTYLAIGLSGKILRSNGSAPLWSTPTFPNTATTGKLLRADGTNWVETTATYPNTATVAGKLLRADGTNWVESGATYPNIGSATNNRWLKTSGTNFVESSTTIDDSPVANRLMYSSSTSAWSDTTNLTWDETTLSITGDLKVSNGITLTTPAAINLITATGSAGALTLSGGAPGANIELYGSTHAQAGKAYIDSAGLTLRSADGVSTTTLTVNGTVQHTGLVATAGTNVDQLYTVVDSTSTYTLDTWTDTPINATELVSGTYIIQVKVGANDYYSGIMSWNSGAANSGNSDEIQLHYASLTDETIGRIYLRVMRDTNASNDMVLQLNTSVTIVAATNNVTFNLRRMI